VKTAEPTYGSDQNGLVWGYRFAPGQPGESIDCEAAAGTLTWADGGDRFLWLHFSLSNAAAERWLRHQFSLPEGFATSLTESVGSTRVEQEGDSLVGVLHDMRFDFAADSAEAATVSLWVDPRVLVTARLKPLRSIDRLRASVKSGERFRSTAELLAHLLRDQASVLVEIIRQSTARVDAIEDNLLSNRIGVSRAELGSLRRVLVRLQRLLAPEPAALFRLLSRPPGWIKEDDTQDLRHSAEEFSAAVADAAALVERVKLIQEELAALISEQNNRSLFVLTVVTVLAVPFNLIAGLFGMNVGGIPFAEASHGFAVIVVVVASVTAVVGYLAYRRRRD